MKQHRLFHKASSPAVFLSAIRYGASGFEAEAALPLPSRGDTMIGKEHGQLFM